MPYNYFNVNDIYTAETIGIKLSELEKIDDNARHLSESINIDIDTLYDKPFWFLYNGEYYYYKEIDNALRLLNELLGQYFSEYMNLPTIKYDIALNSEGIAGVLSKNFREPGKKYVEGPDLPVYYYMYIDYLLRFKDGANHELKRKIDSLLAKDLFTFMIDRHANTLCTTDTGIDLAPQFDYEYSLSFRDLNGNFRTDIGYANPIFRKFPYYDERTRFIDVDMIKKIMKRDKQLLREFEKMYAIDIAKVLESISSERKLTIPDEIRDYYSSFYNERKQRLMKTIK